MSIALLALAVPAWAATALLSDDANGDIAAKWVVEKPTNDAIQPWQKSDSSTPKFPRQTRAKEGTSYWSGVSPNDNDPVAIIEGSSFLRLKEPILIPADGTTTFSMFSLFQNEGDDQGLVEIAPDVNGSPPDAKAWKKFAEYKLPDSAPGDAGKFGYCNPADPAGTAGQPFEEIKGDFKPFAGRKVWLRIHLRYGNANRAATQACDWYVDDIKIETTGTPGNGGGGTGTPPATTPPATETPAPAPAAPRKSSATITAFKAKRKAATLKVNVVNGPVRSGVVTLLKGKKKLSTFKFKQDMDSGVNPVTLKLKKKLKKGAYTVRFTGTGADGSAVAASTKVKLKK
jgi:methionine-rich copper-binding protein CopC